MPNYQKSQRGRGNAQPNTRGGRGGHSKQGQSGFLQDEQQPIRGGRGGRGRGGQSSNQGQPRGGYSHYAKDNPWSMEPREDEVDSEEAEWSAYQARIHKEQKGLQNQGRRPVQKQEKYQEDSEESHEDGKFQQKSRGGPKHQENRGGARRGHKVVDFGENMRPQHKQTAHSQPSQPKNAYQPINRNEVPLDMQQILIRNDDVDGYLFKELNTNRNCIITAQRQPGKYINSYCDEINQFMPAPFYFSIRENKKKQQQINSFTIDYASSRVEEEEEKEKIKEKQQDPNEWRDVEEPRQQYKRKHKNDEIDFQKEKQINNKVWKDLESFGGGKSQVNRDDIFQIETRRARPMKRGGGPSRHAHDTYKDDYEYDEQDEKYYEEQDQLKKKFVPRNQNQKPPQKQQVYRENQQKQTKQKNERVPSNHYEKKYVVKKKGDHSYRRTYFQSHLTDKDEIQREIDQALLFRAKFRGNAFNARKCFATVDGLPVDVMMDDFKLQNRAVDGDSVVIELLSTSLWKTLPVQNYGKFGITNSSAVETRIIDEGEVDITDIIPIEELKEGDQNSDWEDQESSSDESSEKKQKQKKDTGVKTIQETKPKIDFHPRMRKEERLDVLREVCHTHRPLARVVAIEASPVRGKPIMITIKPSRRLTQKDIEAIKAGLPAGETLMAVPVQKSLPWFYLELVPQEFVDDILIKRDPSHRYYVAEFLEWTDNKPKGILRITECIGEAGNLQAECMRILKSHAIYTDDYDPPIEGKEGSSSFLQIQESLRIFQDGISKETGEWTIPQSEIDRRWDLREERIFTIDPATAKDLDDALSIKQISDDLFEIGVHIADVSYFVQQGSELDKEAQLRYTSVYFVHKVYPMLPRILCERLCSLNPKVERLAYSCFFRIFKSTGKCDESYKPMIGRSVIKTCAKWNYDIVQEMIDGKITSVDQVPQDLRPIEGHKFEDMLKDVFLMNEIAGERRKRRLELGSIMMFNKEFYFQLDPETQLPVDYKESLPMASKKLVEEYMLLANVHVACFLREWVQDKTLLRVHEEVNQTNQGVLEAFYKKLGVDVDTSSSLTFSKSIEALQTSYPIKFSVVIKKFMTALKAAKYMCINDFADEFLRHYGLSFDLYTHFTSPIRRYADLLVHRLVTVCLEYKDQARKAIEHMDYSSYADLCSEKSLNARTASKECQNLFHCLLIKSLGTQVFPALVFDCADGVINLSIEENNLRYKLKLRDEPRVSKIVYLDDCQINLILLKTPIKKEEENKKSGSQMTQRQEEEMRSKSFSEIKTIGEFEDLKQSPMGNFMVSFRVCDFVHVFVDTTTEFPLDIVCTLAVSEEEQIRFASMSEAQKKQREDLRQNKKDVSVPSADILAFDV